MPTALASRYEVDAGKLELLSPREATLLGMASQGFLDKEIAAEWGLSLNTLRTYWNRIRSKVGSGSRVALSSAYLGMQINNGVPLSGGEPASYEINPQSWTVRYFEPYMCAYLGVEQGEEFDFERVLKFIHPEDEPRVRSLISYVKNESTPSYAYRARFVSRRGMFIASAYVEVVRDETGRALLLRGRRIPIMDLSDAGLGDIAVGRYRRNLQTGAVSLDAGCREIFRISESEDDVRAAILACYHPEDIEQARDSLDEMVQKGLTRMTRTFRPNEGEERYRWISAEMHVNYGADGPEDAEVVIIAYN